MRSRRARPHNPLVQQPVGIAKPTRTETQAEIKRHSKNRNWKKMTAAKSIAFA